MAKHINADKYVEKSKIFAQMIFFGFRAPDMTVTEFVDDLPAADVQEVKHGRFYLNELDDKWTCTVCGKSIYYYGIPSHNYCPYCGAKMDEEGNKL